MGSQIPSDEIAYEFGYIFRIYKDGRIDRFRGTQILPPSTDLTGVHSKDVPISPDSSISARLFLPTTTTTTTTSATQKLPLLIYIHGGAFCIESPFSPTYHPHLTTLVSQIPAVAVSIHYRLAPEHPLPTCYDDAWTATQWIASHASGAGPEPWLNDHADFNKVFIAGDSAGANIAHDVAVTAGVNGLENGVRIVGMVLVHPFFGTNEEDKLWNLINPTSIGLDDPRLNPGKDPRLEKVGCDRVLVMVAAKDRLKDRGWNYYEALKKSGWRGVVDIVEDEDEGHVYHLINPGSDRAVNLVKRFVSFVNK